MINSDNITDIEHVQNPKEDVSLNVKSKPSRVKYYKTIAGRLKKKSEKKFTINIAKLTNAEMLEIQPIDIKDDFLVPVEIAAKIKGISVQAIYKAINSGGLKKVSGVLLSSLAGYKVNKKEKTKEDGNNQSK